VLITFGLIALAKIWRAIEEGRRVDPVTQGRAEIRRLNARTKLECEE
jgi:hypothetical protein